MEKTADPSDAAVDTHHKISYLELAAANLDAVKAFYAAVFGWTFQDWGPDYASFHGAGLDGGFARSDKAADGGPLVILYSADLEASAAAVEAAGGAIVQAAFEFPGGRRFHFRDPAGNELAVWSDKMA